MVNTRQCTCIKKLKINNKQYKIKNKCLALCIVCITITTGFELRIH